MNDILNIVKKTGNFWFALSILKAIRSKVEYNLTLQGLFDASRIGQSFKKGFKGVLAVGQGGGGKTSTLESIYRGLELHHYDENDNQLGIWVPSGISTGVGLFELLEEHNDAIIVIDELDASTAMHINILKQIASGSISRMKHGSTHSVPFIGVLLGATNGIPFKKSLNDHIVAMLERFTLCHIETMHDSDEAFFAAEERLEPTPDEWEIIQHRMLSDCDYTLEDEEMAFAKELFLAKAAENLEPGKALYRQAHDVQDILVFLKRFCDIDYLMDDDSLLEVARNLVDKTVHCNPAKFLAMNPIERHVYRFIDESPDHTASLAKITGHCNDNGYFVTAAKLRSTLGKMIEVRILNRHHDGFTTRKVGATNKRSVMSDVL